MDENAPRPPGCRYFAASGCMLGFGAVLVIIFAFIAAFAVFGAGIYSLAEYLWSVI